MGAGEKSPAPFLFPLDATQAVGHNINYATMSKNDLNKIIALLSESKHSLDKAHTAALEALDARKDIDLYEGMVEDDISFAKEEGEDVEKYSARSKERLEEARRDYIKALDTLTLYGKGLEDDLGSAGRVSDHFNGKVYPLGMSPL